MLKTTFPLGQLLITPGARDTLNQMDVIRAVQSHRTCDWGIVCDEDKAVNDEALATGGRILSAYRDRNDTKFWIITEWDRSATTILLPDEY